VDVPLAPVVAPAATVASVPVASPSPPPPPIAPPAPVASAAVTTEPAPEPAPPLVATDDRTSVRLVFNDGSHMDLDSDNATGAALRAAAGRILKSEDRSAQ
jgi:hypothetical protein